MPRLSWNEIQDRAVAARDPGSILAKRSDLLTMPPDLTKAHQALDRAVDRLYRRNPFASDKDRLELLFERYHELTGGIAAVATTTESGS